MPLHFQNDIAKPAIIRNKNRTKADRSPCRSGASRDRENPTTPKPPPRAETPQSRLAPLLQGAFGGYDAADSRV